MTQNENNFLKLGQPALRALTGAGIQSLEQLAGYSEAEICLLHGMGPKALNILREALHAKGLSFKEERHEEFPMSSKQDTFSEKEKAAMKERAKELKAEARMNKDRAEGEKAVFAAIAQMQEHDQLLAKRLHELITANAPELRPKTWYGMPAYANKDGKVICFFQAASKFNVRYATFGFQPDASLDEGAMWATSFALKELTPAEEEKIAALVKKAVQV